MKKMIHLSLFLAILGLLSAGILATIYYLTDERRQELINNVQNEALIGAGMKDIVDFEDSSVFIDGVTSIKVGVVGDNKKAFAIYVSGKNSYVEISMVVIILEETKEVYDIVYLSVLSSHSMDEALKYASVEALDSVTPAITNVSGATVSSNTINEMLNIVITQLMYLGDNPMPVYVSRKQDMSKFEAGVIFYNFSFTLGEDAVTARFGYNIASNTYSIDSGLDSYDQSTRDAFLAVANTKKPTDYVVEIVSGATISVKVSVSAEHAGRITATVVFDQAGVITNIIYNSDITSDYEDVSPADVKVNIEQAIGTTNGAFQNYSGATNTCDGFVNIFKMAIAAYKEVK